MLVWLVEGLYITVFYSACLLLFAFGVSNICSLCALLLFRCCCCGIYLFFWVLLFGSGFLFALLAVVWSDAEVVFVFCALMLLLVVRWAFSSLLCNSCLLFCAKIYLLSLFRWFVYVEEIFALSCICLLLVVGALYCCYCGFYMSIIFLIFAVFV